METNKNIILSYGLSLEPVTSLPSGDVFYYLLKDDKLIDKTLYQVGGIGHHPTDGYLTLLKITFSKWTKDDNVRDKDIGKLRIIKEDTILNSNGEIKQIINQYKHPYLKGGVLYSVDNKLYNIETGEFIIDGHNSISSDNYIFVKSQFNGDKTLNGVWQIEKATGNITIIN